MKRIFRVIFAAIAAAVILSGCSGKTEEAREENPSGSDSIFSKELSDEELNFIKSFDVSYNAELAEALGELKTTDMTGAAYRGSLTEAYLSKLMGEESFRVVMMSDTTGLEIASSGDTKSKLSMLASDRMRSVITNGKTMYYYDPMDGGSYKITLSDEELAEYSRIELINGAIGVPDASAEVLTVSVNAGGTEYDAEIYCGMIYVFDKSGNIVMAHDENSYYAVKAEFGIPDSVFSLPVGAKITDYDALTAPEE